jgi:hypothetical protein
MHSSSALKNKYRCKPKNFDLYWDFYCMSDFLYANSGIKRSMGDYSIPNILPLIYIYIYSELTQNRRKTEKITFLKVNFNISLPSMPRPRQLSDIPVSQAKSLYTPLSYPTRAVNLFQLIFLHWYGNLYEVDNITLKYWMHRTDRILLMSTE